MESSRFDRLTKTLASASSRRQALKALAVAAVGGVIGVRSTGIAYADGNRDGDGNRACAHFCAAVFGDDTRAAGRCTRDAAHGTGLCYTCGPASPGGGIAPAAICCTRTRRGHCDHYDGAACCHSGQTCQHGTCVTLATTTIAPTTTQGPGVTTTHAPGTTIAPSTTGAPVTTTIAPVTTTTAPVTTTIAPVLTTTHAPGVTTTRAPGTTIAPSTTRAPVTTTIAPVLTTTVAP